MKLNTVFRNTILFFLVHSVPCFSEEPSSQFESWNSGSHFSHPSADSDIPKIVSALEKDGITYQYVVSGREKAVVRKILPDSSQDELYFLGIGRSFSIHPVSQTYLIDVYESQDELAVLVLASQKFVFMKAVKDYQALPAGMYSLDLPLEAEQNWKPVYWSEFVPDGLLLTDLHGSADAKLQDVNLSSASSVEITFKGADSGAVDIYAFSDDGVKKNDVVIEETFHENRVDGDGYSVLTSARSDLFVSENELLDELEARSDQILLEDLEPFLVEDAIGPNLLGILSSFTDQPRAQAVKARIEALLNE